jgi:hypothetical protein
VNAINKNAPPDRMSAGRLVSSGSSDRLERVVDLVKAVADQLGAVAYTDESAFDLVTQHVSTVPRRTDGIGDRTARAAEP